MIGADSNNCKTKLTHKIQRKTGRKFHKIVDNDGKDFLYLEKKKQNYINTTNHFYKRNEYKSNSFISFKKLNEIMNKDDNEIIQFFMKYEDLPGTINNTKFTIDMNYLMLEIMSRIILINSGPSRIIIKQIVENTNFIEYNIKFSLMKIDLDDEKYLNFLLNVVKFSDKMLDKFSYVCKRIRPGDLLEIEDLLTYKQEKTDIFGNDELIKKLLEEIKLFKEKEKLINLNKLKEKEEKKKANKNDIRKSAIIPIDYKTANLLLTMEDFNEKYMKEIAPHIKYGPYYSYERYINTIFYLEREDCYRS